MVAPIYVGSYVLLDWISFIQPVLKLGITPWSPQAGLTVAFLLWAGPRWAPCTLLAALTSELLVRSAPASLPALFVASLWIAATYAGLARWLSLGALRDAVSGLGGAVRLVLAALTTALVAAVGYVGTFLLAHSLPLETAASSVVRYAMGDLNGILMCAPLLLAMPQWKAAVRSISAGRLQAAAQVATVVLFVWLLFGLESSDRLRFFYPLFVPVIWIAVRWGALGALMAALVIQVGIVFMLRDAPPSAPLIDLQILMLTLVITGLLLGAVVTERAQALRRLATGEAELRAVLAAAPDAVITADPQGVVHSGNHAAQQLFGTQFSASMPLQRLLPGFGPDYPSGRMTLQARRDDDSRFPADVAWVKVEPPARPGWLVLIRDATGRIRTQSEAQERERALGRAMRFAVAGELASALTHELNQPITALVSYLRACQIMTESGKRADERLADTLAKATHESVRASQVLRRLRDFYQGASPGSGPAALETCCAAVVELLEPRLQRQGVEVTMVSDSGLPPVQGDLTHVEMVVHNLVTNAADALSAPVDARREVRIRASATGDRVFLHVHDSGPGVAPDALEQLFEPFNTTKPDGMGLGLALSRTLVRAQGGDISYRRSELLGGACFEVQLPAFRPAAH